MNQPLTIGILLTDHVLHDLLDEHGDQTDFYLNIFHLADPTIILKFYDVVLGEYPKDVKECHGYLITGSKLSVYDDEDWIRILEDYIKELDDQKYSLLGICFGHQLIAKSLGGEAVKADDGWTVGIQNYSFHSRYPWVKDQSVNVSLIHSHQDQVTQLPKKAELIASTTNVPIAMFRIGSHIMSMQGHPEFTSNYAQAVLDKRMGMLDKNLYETASYSLKNNQANDIEVAKWWVKFFNSNIK